jgi:hypothetical protein
MPWLFEPRRIAGDKAVFPDDDDKERIMSSGTTSLIGIVHFCVTVKGDVESSTGAAVVVLAPGESHTV